MHGRSHPQLAVEIARKARETFKTWISAFAEMTAEIRNTYQNKKAAEAAFSEEHCNQTLNDEPQPQLVLAFGFLITNCAPCRPSW